MDVFWSTDGMGSVRSTRQSHVTHEWIRLKNSAQGYGVDFVDTHLQNDLTTLAGHGTEAAVAAAVAADADADNDDDDYA